MLRKLFVWVVGKIGEPPNVDFHSTHLGPAVRIRRFHSTTIPQQPTHPPTTNNPPTKPLLNHNPTITMYLRGKCAVTLLEKGEVGGATSEWRWPRRGGGVTGSEGVQNL